MAIESFDHPLSLEYPSSLGGTLCLKFKGRRFGFCGQVADLPLLIRQYGIHRVDEVAEGSDGHEEEDNRRVAHLRRDDSTFQNSRARRLRHSRWRRLAESRRYALIQA